MIGIGSEGVSSKRNVNINYHNKKKKSLANLAVKINLKLVNLVKLYFSMQYTETLLRYIMCMSLFL